MGRTIPLILIAILILFSCGPKKENVVARIGNQTITLKEFRLAYLELLKEPNVFDSQMLREKFLTELIHRKLFARLARERGFQNDEKIRGLVEAYREKCLREAHYKAVIEPKVKTDEQELKAVYAYMDQQRKIKHLFFATKMEAMQAYNRLRTGADWNTVAEKVFDGTPLANTGGELGWVHWDQLEYPLAMAAFSQPRGTFGKPVQGTFGYHIIFVEDLKLNPLLTEEEFKAHRSKTLKLLKARKGQSLAAKYIKKRMRGVQIRVNPAVMNQVARQLGPIFRRRPTLFDPVKTFQLTQEEMGRLEQSLWDLRNQVLVTIDGRPLTVKKFIFALNFVPYAQVRKGMKNALDFVLRDQVLTSEAKKMHLERHYNFVRLKPLIYEDYLLSLKMRRALTRKVSVTAQDMRQFWTTHWKTSGNVLPDSVKPLIRRMALNEKRKKCIEHTLDSLETVWPIEEDVGPIHAFYREIAAE